MLHVYNNTLFILKQKQFYNYKYSSPTILHLNSLNRGVSTHVTFTK